MVKQIILEDLSHEEKIKYLENRRKSASLKLTGHNKPVRYEILQSTQIIANRNTLLNSTSEKEWLIREVLPVSDGFVYDLSFLKNEVTKHTPVYDEIMDFSRKIYETYSHLMLKTNPYGRLTEVTNKEEISQKWEQIKKYELNQFFTDKEISKIIPQLDQEIRDPLPGFRKDWLYMLFFITASDKRNEGNKGKAYPSDILMAKSFFLQGIDLQLRNIEKITGMDETTITIQHNSSLMEEEIWSGSPDTHKLYKQQYEALFGTTFQHQFQHHADYVLDRATGLIRSCKAIVWERLNEQLYGENIFEIKQKNTEI